MLRICLPLITSSVRRLMHPEQLFPNNPDPATGSSGTTWSDRKHPLALRSIRVQAVPTEAGRSGTMLLRQNLSLAANDRRVVSPRRLDSSLLSRIIDVNDAEALGVAVGPLVVVEQRPGVVAAQVHALRHR